MECGELVVGEDAAREAVEVVVVVAGEEGGEAGEVEEVDADAGCHDYGGEREWGG